MSIYQILHPILQDIGAVCLASMCAFAIYGFARVCIDEQSNIKDLCHLNRQRLIDQRLGNEAIEEAIDELKRSIEELSDSIEELKT